MRLICTMAVLVVVVLMPALAFAGGGQMGIGQGAEYGGLGFNYEFRGKTLTPTVGIGFAGAGIGGNYYFTDKKKHDMPRGWRAQLMGDVLWVGGAFISLQAGQRTGNWDWGVGLGWISVDKNVFGTFSDDSGVLPCSEVGFRF